MDPLSPMLYYIEEVYLIILHPDNKNYRRLRLNFLPDEVKAMLDCRLRAVTTGATTGIVLPFPHE